MWEKKALLLQKKVDAFFVLNHSTLKDEMEKPVDELKAGAWYLRDIKKPEVVTGLYSVKEGMLSVADDSGFKQGYEAIKITHRILHGKEDPALIGSYAPERGAFTVNRKRAKMLGILDRILKTPLIEAWVEKSLAIQSYP